MPFLSLVNCVLGSHWSSGEGVGNTLRRQRLWPELLLALPVFSWHLGKRPSCSKETKLFAWAEGRLDFKSYSLSRLGILAQALCPSVHGGPWRTTGLKLARKSSSLYGLWGGERQRSEKDRLWAPIFLLYREIPESAAFGLSWRESSKKNAFIPIPVWDSDLCCTRPVLTVKGGHRVTGRDEGGTSLALLFCGIAETWMSFLICRNIWGLSVAGEPARGVTTAGTQWSVTSIQSAIQVPSNGDHSQISGGPNLREILGKVYTAEEWVMLWLRQGRCSLLPSPIFNTRRQQGGAGAGGQGQRDHTVGGPVWVCDPQLWGSPFFCHPEATHLPSVLQMPPQKGGHLKE